jgi:hypothetical protein
MSEIHRLTKQRQLLAIYAGIDFITVERGYDRLNAIIAANTDQPSNDVCVDPHAVGIGISDN